MFSSLNTLDSSLSATSTAYCKGRLECDDPPVGFYAPSFRQTPRLPSFRSFLAAHFSRSFRRPKQNVGVSQHFSESDLDLCNVEGGSATSFFLPQPTVLKDPPAQCLHPESLSVNRLTFLLDSDSQSDSLSQLSLHPEVQNPSIPKRPQKQKGSFLSRTLELYSKREL